MTLNPLRPEDSVGYVSPSKPEVDRFIEAALAEGEGHGLDPEYLLDEIDQGHVGPVRLPDASFVDIPHEPTAAERVAEHTGHGEWLKVEVINHYLTRNGKPLTSAEQAYLAHVIATPLG